MRVNLSNVKPMSMGFMNCTVCERGDTPHTEHDGPYVRVAGADLDEYWSVRDQYKGVRDWYAKNR